MKFYIRHKIRNVIDIKWLVALEYLNFEGKYKNYVEKHDFWELCFVEKGRVNVVIDEQTLSLEENEVFLIAPNQTHSYLSSDLENRAFVVCFECFSQTLKTLSGSKFVLDENLADCMERIISEHENTFFMNDKDLLEVLPNANFGGQQAIILQLEYLFICLLRQLSTNKNPEVVFLNKEDFYSELTDL
ncbi:MAG: AraC family ligand binding domain-containing protein, partial [Clostridia bacterium]|nr:AraC family ligand binding domain-containing protein [Clostridia bacterium]